MRFGRLAILVAIASALPVPQAFHRVIAAVPPIVNLAAPGRTVSRRVLTAPIGPWSPTARARRHRSRLRIVLARDLSHLNVGPRPEMFSNPHSIDWASQLASSEERTTAPAPLRC